MNFKITSLIFGLILSLSAITASEHILKVSLSPRQALKNLSLIKKLQEKEIHFLKSIPWNTETQENKIELWLVKSNDDPKSLKNKVKNLEFIQSIETLISAEGQSITRPYHLQNEDLQMFINSQSPEVKVAILDSGIDLTHPDFKDRLVYNHQDPINGIDDDQNGYIDDYYGYNFVNNSPNIDDDNGHGSHLAGIIAAKLNTQNYCEGIAKNAKLIIIKCLDQQLQGNHMNLSAAIIYAVNRGAKVINCSWAIKKESPLVQEALLYAKSKNVIVVAAAGNKGQPDIIYPASYPEVISVTALDNNLELSKNINANANFDFALPGEKILAATRYNQHQTLSGSSQSTAFLSAIIAKFIGQYPEITPENLKEKLLLSSTKIQQREDKHFFKLSYPLLNHHLNTFSQIEKLPIQNKKSQQIQSKVWPNPAQNKKVNFLIQSPLSSLGSPISIHIFNQTGENLKTIKTSYSPNKQIIWDPKDKDGKKVAKGSYIYVIKNQQNQLKKGIISIL